MDSAKPGLVGRLKGLIRPRTSDDRSRGRPEVHVGCFGKHPAWEDHMDHIGFETEHMVQVWQSLYQEGVRANLDTGTWAKNLEEGERLAGFDHEFLWFLGDTVDLGRLWASRDKKGRANYPMVACVSSLHTGFDWLCRQAPDSLTALRERCGESATQEEVRAAAASALQDLRAALPTGPVAPSVATSGEALRRIAGLEPFQGEPEQLVRVVYHIERECLPRSSDSQSTLGRPRFHAHFLRVPAVSESVTGSLRLWVEAVAHLVPAAPVFACRARGEGWVDLTVGFPGVDEVFAMLARPEALPLVTSIPYEIEDEHRARILSLAGRG